MDLLQKVLNICYKIYFKIQKSKKLIYLKILLKMIFLEYFKEWDIDYQC